MKIEKLTDNKIRVIACSDDLDTKNLDFFNVLENTNFFPSVLDKANKLVGFNTDGCELIIEAISSFDDTFVFTITKRIHTKDTNLNTADSCCKKLIYKFNDFEDFCRLCEYCSRLNIKKFCKRISLYFYNNTYFLYVENISDNNTFAKAFNLIASEFATPISHFFECKLLEYGEIVIKHNAILNGIRYFVH